MASYKGTKDIILEWIMAYKKLHNKNPSYSEYRVYTEQLWGVKDANKIRNNNLVKYFNPNNKYRCFVRNKNDHTDTVDIFEKNKK